MVAQVSATWSNVTLARPGYRAACPPFTGSAVPVMSLIGRSKAKHWQDAFSAGGPTCPSGCAGTGPLRGQRTSLVIRRVLTMPAAMAQHAAESRSRSRAEQLSSLARTDFSSMTPHTMTAPELAASRSIATVSSEGSLRSASHRDKQPCAVTAISGRQCDAGPRSK